MSEILNWNQLPFAFQKVRSGEHIYNSFIFGPAFSQHVCRTDGD